MKEAYENYLAIKAKYPGKSEVGGLAVEKALAGLLAAVAAFVASNDEHYIQFPPAA